VLSPHRQLLWAADASLPDLRGAEQSDAAGEAAFTDDQPRVDVSETLCILVQQQPPWSKASRVLGQLPALYCTVLRLLSWD